MKRILLGIGTVALVASMASPSQALTIDMGGIVDVGGEDWLMGEIDKDPLKAFGCGNGSNPDVELCWANAVLGQSLTGYFKTEGVSVYQTIEDPDIIAFQLSGFGSGPSAFVVKNSTWHAVYTNHDDLGWGVIDTSKLDPGFNLDGNSTSISHVTELPEPGTLALLGAGLAMVGIRYRRRMK